MIALGGWPNKKSEPTIKDVITRKTKLMGCLPACLFRTATEEEPAPGPNVQLLLSKRVFTKMEAHSTSYSDKVPKNFRWDQKPLLVEVIHRGQIADMLTAVESTDRLAHLIAQANHTERRLADFSFIDLEDKRQRTPLTLQ